jgi:fatty-acid desaturase
MDTSAVVIRLMERMGLVKDVKWPSAERIERKLAKTATPSVPADS